MGCASSSPLVTANGGVLGAAKGAATDAVHVGEEALHDVKGSINETVGHVKEAVVGAVHSVGHGIEHVINGNKQENSDIHDAGVMNKDSTSSTEAGREADFKIIPLKDPTERLEKSMEDVAENIQQKSEQVKEEADKLADDLIKETEDVVKDSIQETTEKVTSAVNKIVEKSPNHSIDSLKTNSPEPEIEKAMANDTSTNPPTPKPTIAELEQLQSAAETIISDVNAHNQNLAQVPLPNEAKTERGSHVFGNESIIINQALKSIETSAGTSDDEDFDFDFDRSRFPMPENPTQWEKLADSLLQPKPNILKAFRDNREAPFIASTGVEVAEHSKDTERTILF